MSRVRLLLLLPFLGMVTACARTETVARGPIELTVEPREVVFAKPVTAFGLVRELCFEFDKPRDSHGADRMRAVLITVDGHREPLQHATLDRRGERLMCLVAPRSDASQPIRYASVELQSDVPVRLRAVRWYGGSPG